MLLILVAATALATEQTVYRCEDDAGKPVYSERPCSDEADIVVIKDSTSGLAADPEQVERIRNTMTEVKKKRDYSARLRQIRASSNARIREYEKKRGQCEQNIPRTFHPTYGYLRSERALQECRLGYEELIQQERLAMEERLQTVRESEP